MYVKVRVVPGAKKEEITRKSDTEFAIMVREPAERNLANDRIVALIAREFNIRKADVRILSGHRSTSKMLNVEV